MTGQHDWQDERLTGQLPNQFGHCPLTGRYFKPSVAESRTQVYFAQQVASTCNSVFAVRYVGHNHGNTCNNVFHLNVFRITGP